MLSDGLVPKKKRTVSASTRACAAGSRSNGSLWITGRRSDYVKLILAAYRLAASSARFTAGVGLAISAADRMVIVGSAPCSS